MSCSDSSACPAESATVVDTVQGSADHLMYVLCQMVVFQYLVDEDGVGIAQYYHDTPSSSCQLVHNLQRSSLFTTHTRENIGCRALHITIWMLLHSQLPLFHLVCYGAISGIAAPPECMNQGQTYRDRYHMAYL